MKNRLLFIALFLIVFSCKTGNFRHDIDSTPYGVDYREGKWLLNTVDANLMVEERLTAIAKKHFEKKLGENFQYAEDHKSIALSYIPINPDSLLLKRLKKESRADYIINIKAEEIIDEIGSLQLTKVRNFETKSAKTTLQIYDLNTLETIYDSTVIGTIDLSPNNEEKFNFIASENSLMVKALKKILKKI